MVGSPVNGSSGRGCGAAVLNTAEWRAVARSLGLSTRERQIAQRIFDDRKECVIADELGISPHTVHTHLERLYHKVGVGSRCELVVRFVATGERESVSITLGDFAVRPYAG